MTRTRFLGAGLLLVLALGVTGCGARSINDLIADPAKYRNQSVTVGGTVEQSASVAGRGAYQIADRGQTPLGRHDQRRTAPRRAGESDGTASRRIRPGGLRQRHQAPGFAEERIRASRVVPQGQQLEI